MRRLFIMRKDLNMSIGKLAAQVGHCAEAYWLRRLQDDAIDEEDIYLIPCKLYIERPIWDDYINGHIIKTICEARNLNHLLKARDKALELGLEENVDFGLINDKCWTELAPENEDGTTTTGIWFKPLDDDTAHLISKKYQLYK